MFGSREGQGSGRAIDADVSYVWALFLLDVAQKLPAAASEVAQRYRHAFRLGDDVQHHLKTLAPIGLVGPCGALRGVAVTHEARVVSLQNLVVRPTRSVLHLAVGRYALERGGANKPAGVSGERRFGGIEQDVHVSDIVIFGAGPIVDVAVAYLSRHSQDRIVGFTVDDRYKDRNEKLGLPLVAWEELERHFPPESVELLGPISYRRVNAFRKERYLQGKQRGYAFSRFIHPHCDVYTEEIGENCFILERNVIQPFAKIGSNVVIWSGNHIGHHVTIGDHCFITSQVGIAGASRIGEGCFLAGQCGVIDDVHVGDDCFIGPGAMILRSLPAGSVVPGKESEKAPYDISRMRRIL